MTEKPWEWPVANTQDDLEKFYIQILPQIRKAAHDLGYAVGLHGSMRRDLDLIAVPWIENHSDIDILVKAIHMAACGTTLSRYEWEQKPCGRVATCFPVCWTEYKAPSSGHIDLSVLIPNNIKQ